MTEFLIGGRGTGKSRAALRWLRGAGNRSLVVPDSRQAEFLARMDREYAAEHGVSRFYPTHKIIPYSSVQQGWLRERHVELGVDNLDMLLMSIFRSPVGFATATGTLHQAHEVHNHIVIGGS